jgi:DNA modification methylase
MNGQFADLVFTDPPYNVDYVGKTKEALKIQNDKKGDGDFYKFLYDMYLNLYAHMKPGAAFYICHADTEGLNFRKALKDAGLTLKQCLIWVKNSMVMGRQDYHLQHEPILYGWKEGAAHFWYTDRKQTTIWNFDRPSRSEEHPTMKPVNLLKYAITNSSKGKDLVIDPFGGSGSTLIACEATGRIARTMEIDPKYCDVIVDRFVKFSGNKNIRRNGQDFIWE